MGVMKWKIAIKLVYIATLFAIAAYNWEPKESKLIDSDPTIEESVLRHA